jgi:hypothetical protein
MGSPPYGPISATKEDNWLKKSWLSVRSRASKGIKKSSGAFGMGTFWKFLFIIPPEGLGLI